MKYKCIVIDDDSYSIKDIQAYIGSMPQLELLKTYTDSILAASEISSGNQVDFIFMDIEMPGLNGMELAKIIRQKTRFLILTTAHAKYAVDSYEIDASFYLLKPFNIAKFAYSINKVIHKTIENSKPQIDTPIARSFFVKNTLGKPWLTRISTDNVLYLEVKNDHLIVFTTTEKLTASSTLKEAEKLLLGTGEFIKIHRSYIIAVNYILSIDPREIKMANGQTLPLGKSYKYQLFKYVNNNLFKSKL